jgi:hypothetical protein
MEFATITAIIMAITEVFKRAFSIKTKYIPLLAILCGCVVVGFYAYLEGQKISWTVVQNMLISVFTAMGIYSGTKSMVK